MTQLKLKTMKENYRHKKEFQEVYIDYVLAEKKIRHIDYKTTKIAYVYCDNCVYIFNFAKNKTDYIVSSWGNKTKSYLEI